MEAKLYNQMGDHIGTIRVSDYIFGVEPNKSVMHQAMVRQLANARQGTHNTLDRGVVRGSTRKLYRQKGTGRARQGSIRAPHRRGGGVAHGPHPRSYEKKMPRKMRRLAVRSALSVRQANEQIRFVDALEFDRPRTKDMLSLLEAHGLSGKTLIVLDTQDINISRSASNLPNVKTLLANYLNVVDLLSYDNIILPLAAVEVVQGYLDKNGTGELTPERFVQPVAAATSDRGAAEVGEAEVSEAEDSEAEEPETEEPETDTGLSADRRDEEAR